MEKLWWTGAIQLRSNHRTAAHTLASVRSKEGPSSLLAGTVLFLPAVAP